jgi:hypothetical protein
MLWRFCWFDRWRLPRTTQPDASCSDQFNPGSDFPLQGIVNFASIVNLGICTMLRGNMHWLANTGPLQPTGCCLYSGTLYAPYPFPPGTSTSTMAVRASGVKGPLLRLGSPEPRSLVDMGDRTPMTRHTVKLAEGCQLCEDLWV